MLRPRPIAIGSLVLIAAGCRDASGPTPTPTPPLSARAEISEHKRNEKEPAWWDKYQFLLHRGPVKQTPVTLSAFVGGNVDVSNECGPQSETFIALDPNHPSQLTAGSNEIFRLPQRAYFSSNDGSSWGAVDAPLPASPFGPHDQRFSSDPTLAYDTRGHVYYGYIVIFLSPQFTAFKGTEVAVARSTDGGATWPLVSEFSINGGENHFNDKPMLTVDQNTSSPFRDRVYVAWDASFGGSPSGGIKVAHSSDFGLSYSVNRADDARGPGKGIGADPFVGADGAAYVAWNDYARNIIAVNRSLDGGVTWGRQRVIASKTIPFDIDVPAQFNRGALVYPACDADRSAGAHRGRLYCTWMDLNQAGRTGIFLSHSDDRGVTWSSPAAVGHQPAGTDRFNHWFSVDAVTGDVTVAYYNASGVVADYWLSRSTDGGATWDDDVRVSTESSNEHDCAGEFPCESIDYGNQYGDYEGLVSFAGHSHPIWTDSRRNTEQAGDPDCGFGLGLMEEVFSARVEQ
jgi:hypothetical protein